MKIKHFALVNNCKIKIVFFVLELFAGEEKEIIINPTGNKNKLMKYMSFCFTNPENILIDKKQNISLKTFNLKDPFHLNNQWIILRSYDVAFPIELELADLEFFYTSANDEDHYKMLSFFGEDISSFVTSEEGDLLIMRYKSIFFTFYYSEVKWLIWDGFFDFTNLLVSNRIIYQGCIEDL